LESDEFVMPLVSKMKTVNESVYKVQLIRISIWGLGDLII